MTNLVTAMVALVVGTLLGAAIQRWGDRDRATHGHKDYRGLLDLPFNNWEGVPVHPDYYHATHGHKTYPPETNEDVQSYGVNVGDWFFQQ